MKLVVIGTGYVGLVTGTCLAKYGSRVVCVDTNLSRVETLSLGTVPFYEPSLDEMMQRNTSEGRLSFAADAASALKGADACFITVGTPSAADGSADLSFVESAARDIGHCMTGPLLVIVKSTVPVGTNARVRGWITEELEKRGETYELNMASNPEFLREGSAIRDFIEPDRVVVGTDSRETAEMMMRIYSFADPAKLLFMDIPSAEMTKYASNAMLAARISFMNEMASICDRMGANIDNVSRAMGMDTRIGSQFLRAGCGYGGSCFPKDVRALRDFARSAGCEPDMLSAIEAANDRAKTVPFQKLSGCFGGELKGKTVAVWGLSFKPRTSDTREAPAQTLILALLDAGAKVRASDPRAIDETRDVLAGHDNLLYAQDPYDALEGADALAVMTEWDIYRQPDFERMKNLMRRPLIVDGRNIYSPMEMHRHGFEYISTGRPPVLRKS